MEKLTRFAQPFCKHFSTHVKKGAHQIHASFETGEYVRSYFHNLPLRSKENKKAEINCTVEYRVLSYCDLDVDELDPFVEGIKHRTTAILQNSFARVKINKKQGFVARKKLEHDYLDTCLRLIGLFTNKVGLLPVFKEARITHSDDDTKKYVL
jgi:hypothetical protein